MLADSDSSSDSERTLSDAAQETRSDSGPPAPASSTQDLSSAHSVTQIDSEATLTDPAMRDMRARANRAQSLEQTALTLVRALGLPIDVPVPDAAEVGEAIIALARRAAASERAGARSASVRSASSGSASVVGGGGGSGAVLAAVGDGSDGVAGAGAAGDAAASEGAAGGAAEGAAGSEGADGGGRGRKRKSPPTPRSGSPNLP